MFVDGLYNLISFYLLKVKLFSIMVVKESFSKSDSFLIVVNSSTDHILPLKWTEELKNTLDIATKGLLNGTLRRILLSEENIDLALFIPLDFTLSKGKTLFSFFHSLDNSFSFNKGKKIDSHPKVSKVFRI